MNSAGRTKLNDQICEEAAEWLVELRLGDLDAGGRRALDAWIRASPVHLRAFIEMAALWEGSGREGAWRNEDVEALIARARADNHIVSLERGRGSSASAPLISTSRQPLRKSWAAAAAAVIAIIILGAVLRVQFHGQRLYTTEFGEQRLLRLADGSTVTLNSRSRLRVQFTDTERKVELLQGQALFRVAKNQSRPFTVRVDDTSVRAVGTQFDVNRNHEGTIVTVVEGRVAVLTDASAARPDQPGDTLASSNTVNSLPSAAGALSHPPAVANVKSGPGILLSAGEQLTVTTRAASAAKRADVSAATAWTQGQLVLESASLAEVAEEFSRYSARKLIAIDHGTHPLRLSGVFGTDPDFLIQSLRLRPDIVVHESADEIVIERVR